MSTRKAASNALNVAATAEASGAATALGPTGPRTRKRSMTQRGTYDRNIFPAQLFAPEFTHLSMFPSMDV